MDDAGFWTAWLGATVFEFGSVFGLWEAWNRSNVVDFGRAIESAFSQDAAEKSAPPHEKWIWFSTEGKYWHELGFLAAFVQFLAAVSLGKSFSRLIFGSQTIFWIAGYVICC